MAGFTTARIVFLAPIIPDQLSMVEDFIRELREQLANSDSRLRKHWAARIRDESIRLGDLMVLLHGDTKVAQRFSWLLGDVCVEIPERFAEQMPMLFSLRDEMPFSGMHRSIAKWLLLTNIPTEIEVEAIEQLFRWMESDRSCIASKSFSAKALVEMVRQGRANYNRCQKVLHQESQHRNRAYASRMAKALSQLESLRTN